MDITNRITRFSNLDISDSLSAFDNLHAQQSHFAYQVFYEFISEVKPDRILEIGTALGGFTEFLKIITQELGLNTEILSYDIAERPWYNQMIEKGIDIRVFNIFNEDWTDIDSYTKEFIKKDGLTIVLCDGGLKKFEFNLLSNFIKEGDFILAHDYAEDRQDFENRVLGKIWNWFEIQNSDIIESCKRNNLNYYKKELFESAAWTCRVKSKQNIGDTNESNNY